jgi:hypothetical protein
MSEVMWQIGEFLLDICVKLFCNDCAHPLNPFLTQNLLLYYVAVFLSNI